MILTTAQLAEPGDRWYCLRTKPKTEWIASGNLNKVEGVTAFCPRIRFRRATKRGPVWFVEALFPGYLFARFAFPDLHRRVQSAHGVTQILRFGQGVAALSDEAVHSLRQVIGADETIAFDPGIQLGDTIRIVEGAFRGLDAVVTQLLPAGERIKVLMEFLGRSVEAEVAVPSVLPATSPRLGTLGRNG